MTKEQAQAIRKLVDQGGWDAVRNHQELSKVWAAFRKASKDYTNSVIDQ